MDDNVREAAAHGDYTEERGPYCIGSTIWPGAAKLIEEMGELAQALAKIMSTSGGTEYWDGTDLRRRLLEELADVQAAHWFFMTMNGFMEAGSEEWQRYCERVGHKEQKFVEWHHKQLAETAKQNAERYKVDSTDGTG